MMLTRNTVNKMESLDLMLESCIKDHSSHERRNEHMSAIRRILDNWISDLRRYQDEYDRAAKAIPTLEAIYQLCIWQLDHETHTDVKTRLFMARNLILRFQFRRDKAVSDGINKRSREIIRSRVETSDLPEVEESAFEHPLPQFENMDVSYTDHDSSGERPGDDWGIVP